MFWLDTLSVISLTANVISVLFWKVMWIPHWCLGSWSKEPQYCSLLLCTTFSVHRHQSSLRQERAQTKGLKFYHLKWETDKMGAIFFYCWPPTGRKRSLLSPNIPHDDTTECSSLYSLTPSSYQEQWSGKGILWQLKRWNEIFLNADIASEISCGPYFLLSVPWMPRLTSRNSVIRGSYERSWNYLKHWSHIGKLDPLVSHPK